MDGSGTADDETTALGPRQVFHSAEHVALEVPIAGPTSRILAYAIDSVCVATVLAGFLAAALLLTPMADWILGWVEPAVEQIEAGQAPDLTGSWVLYAFAVLVLVEFALEALYFIVLELVTGGRSIGKMILGLQVRRDGGLPPSPSATITRNLLRFVDILPMYYLTGLVSMVLSADGKRLGDHAAGTIVVRLDRPPPALPIAVGDEIDGDFRFAREHLAALGATERALLRQTLRRLDALAEPQRQQAVDRAAAALGQRLGYRELAAGERERFLRALWVAARR